jgi:uncharacterized protein (DUF302 family)
MGHLEYGIGRVVPGAYDEVLPNVRDALTDEGFGVLTEIDVQATLGAKLGVERGRYAILGACSLQSLARAQGARGRARAGPSVALQRRRL